MRKILQLAKHKPVRASAQAGLGASGHAPTSNSADFDNFVGFSEATHELSAGLDALLAEILLEGEERSSFN
jgi:hypothetical protein